MTKEIIIDGIDVSDCMYYEPKAIKMTCHEQAITKPCNTSPICYYKLLHKAYKNCERLEQENERLKEENVKLLFAKGALVGFSNKLTKIIDEKKDKENKILQTLQEIKEIAEDAYENDSKYQATGVYNEILQKITKAEEE